MLIIRRYEDLGWDASKVTASQMMLRGKSGMGVRRLSDASIDRQEEPTWYWGLRYIYVCVSCVYLSIYLSIYLFTCSMCKYVYV
jgi:hypothetical protein